MNDSARIINLPDDRRSYVVGMHWESHGTRRPSHKEIKEIASEEGSWVAERRGNSIRQTGFCAPLPEGLPKKGLFALAALVADAKTEPWLGVFDLGDDLYWYVAIRDNNGVLPDGDFVGTKEEVDHARQNAASLGEWREFIDGDVGEISALMEEAKNKNRARVIDINRKPWIRPVATIVVLATAAIVGTTLWHHHEQRLQAIRVQKMIRERAEIAAMRKEHAKETPLPWSITPSPQAVLSACRKKLDDLPISVAGWQPATESCSVTGSVLGIQLKWVPGPGALPAQAPAGEMALDGQSVTGGLPPVTLVHDTSSRLKDSQAEFRALYSVTAPLGVKVSLSRIHLIPHHTALPGAREHAPKAIHKPWVEYRVSMQTHLPILDLDGLGSQLNSVPGLRLQGVSIKKKGSWVITGLLYARRPGATITMGKH